MGRHGRRGDALGLALVLAALAFWVRVLGAGAGLTVAREVALLQGALWAIVVALLAWHWWQAAR